MKKRKFVPRKQSKRSFSKYADQTHYFNLQTSPMRGGIRM